MTTMMTITITLPEGRVVLPRSLVLVASGSVHSSKQGTMDSPTTVEGDPSITCHIGGRSSMARDADLEEAWRERGFV